MPGVIACSGRRAFNSQSVKANQQNAPQIAYGYTAAGVALAVCGFSAVVGQIVLMRELIVAFNGNEIALGMMLATWLLWTAVGSSLSGALHWGTRYPRHAAAALECLLALTLPATIWAVRAAKSVFQTVPGELAGPLPMLLTTLVCLSVYCVLTGALFVVAARMLADAGQHNANVGAARVAAGRAYLLEASGSAVGGVLASVLLLRLFESFQIAILVALLNLWMAAVLLAWLQRRGVFLLAIAAVLVAVPLVGLLAPRLERGAQKQLWSGFNLLDSRDTIYGNLAVTETGAIRSIYNDGAILANAPDPAAAEEAVHYALLEHAAPHRVLLIGGGVNGAIGEALKHPSIVSLDYVELDPALIGMARTYFPAQAAAFHDPRVHLHLMDGRRSLAATPEKFDAILVDIPDPQTAQLNRFYTAEFFSAARQHLAAGGVLAIELRSSEDTMSPELQSFLRCIRRTLEGEFPSVVAIPGETIHFLASAQRGVLTGDPNVLLERLRERQLNTQYVSRWFIPYRMSSDRMQQVESQLRPLPSTPVNRDFAPVAYYYNVVLWSAQFGNAYSRWFQRAASVSFSHTMGAVAVLLLMIVAIMRFARKRARLAPAGCTVATGFTVMALQILLLLGFESVFGYVYYQLAILIGMLMAGMALGSWLAIKCSGPAMRQMAAVQLLLAAAGPLVMVVLSLAGSVHGAALTWVVAQIVFPGVAVLAGALGGFQFAIAARVFVPRVESRAGLGALYALDLLGGCVGALVLSTYLIPVFGFWRTAWMCVLVNAAAVLAALPGGAESESALT